MMTDEVERCPCSTFVACPYDGATTIAKELIDEECQLVEPIFIPGELLPGPNGALEFGIRSADFPIDCLQLATTEAVVLTLH